MNLFLKRLCNQYAQVIRLPVIVYSTPTCPYCVLAKEYLQSKGVEFVDYDVSTNRPKAIEMIKKSEQMGVPVLDIEGEIIVGFDKPRIDAALAK